MTGEEFIGRGRELRQKQVRLQSQIDRLAREGRTQGDPRLDEAVREERVIAAALASLTQAFLGTG